MQSICYPIIFLTEPACLRKTVISQRLCLFYGYLWHLQQIITEAKVLQMAQSLYMRLIKTNGLLYNGYLVVSVIEIGKQLHKTPQINDRHLKNLSNLI